MCMCVCARTRVRVCVRARRIEITAARQVGLSLLFLNCFWRRIFRRILLSFFRFFFINCSIRRGSYVVIYWYLLSLDLHPTGINGGFKVKCIASNSMERDKLLWNTALEYWIYVTSYFRLHLSIYLSIYLSISVHIYLSIYLSLAVHINLSMVVHVYLSIYLSKVIHIYLASYLS